MGQSFELFEQRLRDRRILVVEDEASTIVMAESALTEVGCRVYLAQDIRRALKIAATKSIDCALLDIGIGEDDVFSVADVLAANNIPIVFSSGYDKGDLPDRYQSRIILPKPYLFGDVVRALVAAMSPSNHSRGMEKLRAGDAAMTGDSNASRPDGLHQCQGPGSPGRSAGERGEP